MCTRVTNYSSPSVRMWTGFERPTRRFRSECIAIFTHKHLTHEINIPFAYTRAQCVLLGMYVCYGGRTSILCHSRDETWQRIWNGINTPAHSEGHRPKYFRFVYISACTSLIYFTLLSLHNPPRCGFFIDSTRSV